MAFSHLKRNNTIHEIHKSLNDYKGGHHTVSGMNTVSCVNLNCNSALIQLLYEVREVTHYRVFVNAK